MMSDSARRPRRMGLWLFSRHIFGSGRERDATDLKRIAMPADTM